MSFFVDDNWFRMSSSGIQTMLTLILTIKNERGEKKRKETFFLRIQIRDPSCLSSSTRSLHLPRFGNNAAIAVGRITNGQLWDQWCAVREGDWFLFFMWNWTEWTEIVFFHPSSSSSRLPSSSLSSAPIFFATLRLKLGLNSFLSCPPSVSVSIIKSDTLEKIPSLHFYLKMTPEPHHLRWKLVKYFSSHGKRVTLN